MRAKFIKSPLLGKLIGIGFLILILQIPILQIFELKSGRESVSIETQNEIAEKWGAVQSITGPILSIPFERKVVEKLTSKDGFVNTEKIYTYSAVAFPKELNIFCSVQNEIRYRSIYQVPVYLGKCRISGVFNNFFPADFFTPNETPDFSHATLSLGISDPHALHEGSQFTVENTTLSLEPGSSLSLLNSGIHSDLNLKKNFEDKSQSDISFEGEINIGGSSAILFSPSGQQTHVEIKSDWPAPSFTGPWLPINRYIDEKGFSAKWSVPHLGRNHPQFFKLTEEKVFTVDTQAFGVNFYKSLDHYNLVDRSLKYSILFLSLTFLTIWLFELKLALKVHPMQYFLVGCALVLFYIVLLAVAELIGFTPAFVISSTLMTLIIGFYNSFVLKQVKLVLVLVILVLALYCFLYILLLIESYALLVGSIGLVAVLLSVMLSTRNIDWYRLD